MKRCWPDQTCKYKDDFSNLQSHGLLFSHKPITTTRLQTNTANCSLLASIYKLVSEANKCQIGKFKTIKRCLCWTTELNSSPFFGACTKFLLDYKRRKFNIFFWNFKHLAIQLIVLMVTNFYKFVFATLEFLPYAVNECCINLSSAWRIFLTL